MFGTPQTITLRHGQLELSDTTGTETITGPAAGVTVSGGGASRVFQVDGGVTASISGHDDHAAASAYSGGGLANTAALHADQLHRQRQLRTAMAAACAINGTATLTDCTVSGNSANNGGGVYINYGGTATLTNCTVSGNSASTGPYSNGAGVDIHGGGTVTLNNCTITGNSGVAGGGMINQFSTATLTDCTISDNSASARRRPMVLRRQCWWAEQFAGTTTLTNCTISGNSAGRPAAACTPATAARPR